VSFTVYPLGRRSPNVSIENMKPEEPVFVALYEDGMIQVVELPLICEWADEMYHNDLEPEHEELYIRLPGSTSLFPCSIDFADGGSAPVKVVITGKEPNAGVLWTAEV